MTSEITPSAWRQSFYSLLRVEKHVIDEQNAQAIGAIVASAAAAGMVNSGRTMSLIASKLADSLPDLVSASIRIIERVVGAHGDIISDSNKSEFIGSLQKILTDHQAQLKHKALGTPPFRMASDPARFAAFRIIDLKASNEIERIAGEINLMAAKKVAQKPLDSTAYEILSFLKEAFVASGLDSSALTNGYVGPSLPDLQQVIIAETSVSQVDFDLSLKALEKNQLVKTGPVAPYENPPGSSVLIFTILSKREYLYLTEDGYRAANRPGAKQAGPRSSQSITIRDSHFHNSPVGAGTTVTQTVNIDVNNENETVSYLYDLLSHNNGNVDASAKQELKEMVEAAHAGDMKAAKPIFQKLFGGAAGAVKELATGVLTAIVNKQLGMDSQ